MSKSKPQHRIAEMFTEIKGNTPDLKGLFSDTTGMSRRKIQLYCCGDKKNLPYDEALLFLVFFNKHRVPELKPYVIEDMYITSQIGVLKKISLS